MTINTVFKPTDVVFLLFKEKIVEAKVQAIGLDPFTDNINYPVKDFIYYFLTDQFNNDMGYSGQGGNKFKEGTLFKTKDELIAAL